MTKIVKGLKHILLCYKYVEKNISWCFEVVSFTDLVNSVDPALTELHDKPVSMEQLGIHDGNGQSYGYIIYRWG